MPSAWKCSSSSWRKAAWGRRTVRTAAFEGSESSSGRHVQTRRGLEVPLREQEWYCPGCRRAFFPSSKALGLDVDYDYSPTALKKVVYAGTQRRVFRKAFVADGSEANWGLWRRHFSHYVPILDFVTVRGAAGDWSIFRRENVILPINRGPKTWTCPPHVAPARIADHQHLRRIDRQTNQPADERDGEILVARRGAHADPRRGPPQRHPHARPFLAEPPPPPDRFPPPIKPPKIAKCMVRPAAMWSSKHGWKPRS